jgi:hypothetical protein
VAALAAAAGAPTGRARRSPGAAGGSPCCASAILLVPDETRELLSYRDGGSRFCRRQPLARFLDSASCDGSSTSASTSRGASGRGGAGQTHLQGVGRAEPTLRREIGIIG